ncbi:MAG: hypothetical protein A2Y31_05835 [Spirochaetes bacterium GWC2_52_13]|nr:MAG: hypothetical protein A2Y31_05835 [Spirochaetes bacterium GWC2_52_13]
MASPNETPKQEKQKPLPATRRNNKLVRSGNTKRILLLVKELEPVSLDTLVQESALTYPTVLGIIKHLEKESHVEKIAYAPTTGGRQAVLFGICGIVRYVLALHLNGNDVDITITNIRDGKIFHATETIPAQAEVQDQTDKHQSIAHRLVPLVGEILKKTRLELSSLVKICVTYPEGTDIDPQLLSDELEGALKVPTSTIADRIVLNFLERRSYHISSLQRYVFILFERELSLSMYRGPCDAAEDLPHRTYFGHMTMDVTGSVCTCGKQGCLQSYVSGDGLLQAYRDAAHQLGSTWNTALEQEDDLFHTVLAESYKGDKAARVAIDQAIRMLAVALANVIKIEGIATIVLSGVFTSTDVQFKRLLELYVAEYLPEDFPTAPVVILGTTSPSDCSYAACLMMNAQYFESLSFE